MAHLLITVIFDLFLDLNSHIQISQYARLIADCSGLSEISQRLHVQEVITEFYAELRRLVQQGVQRANLAVHKHVSYISNYIGGNRKL